MPLLSAAFLLVLWAAACSGSPVPPRGLLLSPADFPDGTVTATSEEPAETSNQEPAVRVELNGPGFTALQSLVLFETQRAALALLATIKQDQIAQGATPQPADGFFDVSAVLSETLDGEEASTLFFVEGRALVRITVAGAGHSELVWDLAGRARQKAKAQ